MNLRSERGVTLTELTVFIVLASIVMLGLVGFYMNSQATWLDASTQALAQREATLLLEEITNQVQGADTVIVTTSVPDRCSLQALKPDGSTLFFWDDSTFSVLDTLGVRRAVATSTVEKFEADANGRLVFIRNLQLRSTSGRVVQLSSTIRVYNQP
jgi:hypothetical protein